MNEKFTANDNPLNLSKAKTVLQRLHPIGWTEDGWKGPGKRKAKRKPHTIAGAHKTPPTLLHHLDAFSSTPSILLPARCSDSAPSLHRSFDLTLFLLLLRPKGEPILPILLPLFFVSFWGLYCWNWRCVGLICLCCVYRFCLFLNLDGSCEAFVKQSISLTFFLCEKLKGCR